VWNIGCYLLLSFIFEQSFCVHLQTTQGKSGTYFYDLHFWIGKDTSQVSLDFHPPPSPSWILPNLSYITFCPTLNEEVSRMLKLVELCLFENELLQGLFTVLFLKYLDVWVILNMGYSCLESHKPIIFLTK